MDSEKDRKFILGLTVVLLAIGIISYAGFSAEPPDNPYRIYYATAGGPVLFDHQTHKDASGYGLSCMDCHHDLEEGYSEDEVTACSECHELTSDDPDMPSHVDSLHASCKNCHEEYEAGPVDCAECHLKP